MRDSITVDLDQPISYPGQETMTKIVIRPYTGKDLLASGLPFSTRQDSKGNSTEIVEMPAVLLLLAAMAAVPVRMIEQMSAVDINLSIQALRAFFFFKTPAKSSTDTLPPGTGAETPGSPSA